MRKINNLLELWKFRSEHYNDGCLDTEIMKWQKDVKLKKTMLTPDIDTDIAFATESLLKPEPFTTKILHELLSKHEVFRKKFLNKIGFNYDLPDVKTEFHEVIDNYQNSYDISFWLKSKLVCIVENKLDADFSVQIEEKNIPPQLERYHKALEKDQTQRRILATLTLFDVRQHPQVAAVNKLSKQSGVQIAHLFWHDIVDLLQDFRDKDKLFKQAIDIFCYMHLNYEEFSQPYNPETRKKVITRIQNIIQKYCGDELACHTSYPSRKGICNFAVFYKNTPKIQNDGKQQFWAYPSVNVECRGHLLGSSHNNVLQEINANILLLKDGKLYVSPRIYSAASVLDNSTPRNEFGEGIWAKTVSYPGNVDSEEKFYEETEALIKKAIVEFKEMIKK